MTTSDDPAIVESLGADIAVDHRSRAGRRWTPPGSMDAPSPSRSTASVAPSGERRSS
ncbi:MAG: hypothetical protein ABW328_09125 [Ilumatobacteraceae bacterium]